MRTVVAPYSAFANQSWPLNEAYTSAMAFAFINSCALGLPTNLIVIYLSFFSKSVTGDFKYFLGNLAIIDVLFCLSNFTTWFIQVKFISNQWMTNVIWCTIQVQPPFTFGIASALALPLISINRYFVIVRESSWFTVKRIAFICLYPYFIVIWWLLFDLFYAPFVAVFVRCGYTLYTPFIPEIFFIPVVLGYFILIFCSWKLYLHISGHITATESLMARSGNDYKGEKAILKAIVIQAFIPLICVAPACIYFVYFNIYGRSAADIVPVTIGNFRPTLEDYAYYTFTISPFCNAIVTLLIVIPYRRALYSLLIILQCVKWLNNIYGHTKYAVRKIAGNERSSVKMFK